MHACMFHTYLALVVCKHIQDLKPFSVVDAFIVHKQRRVLGSVPGFNGLDSALGDFKRQDGNALASTLVLPASANVSARGNTNTQG